MSSVELSSATEKRLRNELKDLIKNKIDFYQIIIQHHPATL
jgi:hypothetical protein